MSTKSDPCLRDAIATSRKYLDLINSKTLSRPQAEELVSLTLRNFADHYNPGFLEYRKSVTEGGDFAAVEWSGRGATFTDVLGRTYLDCLGGYGLLSLGGATKKSLTRSKRNWTAPRCLHRSCSIPHAACWPICSPKSRLVISPTPSLSPAALRPSRAPSSSLKPRRVNAASSPPYAVFMGRLRAA